MPSASTPAARTSSGATRTPRRSRRWWCVWGRGSLRGPAPASDSGPTGGPAVCSCLSAAPRYKVNVICSVKCWPQTGRGGGAANSEAAETPCPAGHRKRGHTGSLCLAPGLAGWRAGRPVQALMRAATRANEPHFPPGLRASRRPLRVRLRICSE